MNEFHIRFKEDTGIKIDDDYDAFEHDCVYDDNPFQIYLITLNGLNKN